MAILNQNREWAENWAYDIALDVVNKGEIFDIDVINQSIEIILSTSYGERVFLPNFGCSLQSYIFNNITSESGEALLDKVISEIKRWENRITINDRECRLKVDVDNNSILLIISYTILRTNVTSKFQKRIINS